METPVNSALEPAPRRFRHFSAEAGGTATGVIRSGDRRKTEPDCGLGASGMNTAMRPFSNSSMRKPICQASSKRANPMG